MPSHIKCCKGCPDRKIVDGVRCHSWCKTYAEEAAKNQKGIDQLYKDNDYNAFKSSNVTKTLRRIRNSNRK